MRGWLRGASRIGLAGAAVTVLVGAGLSTWVRMNPRPKIILGTVPLDPPVLRVVDDVPLHREVAPAPAAADQAATVTGGIPRAAGSGARGLWPPDGKPPGPARPFADPVEASGGLAFVLVLGSDARSGSPDRARADSIHVLAVDPAGRRGTILGIPRDSWVDVPGYGKRKINESLSLGGPALAVRTVRDLTGMPVTTYLVTAFEGARGIVNDLGGIDVHVPYDMNDRNSGAFFQKGWHRMDGERALAFSRNRHVPGGDFGRSGNQGRLMLDVLKKLRAETSTRAEVEEWLRILVRHTRVEMSFPDLVRLGVLARVTSESSVRNVVAPGSTGAAGGGSVVFLGEPARALFADVAADAVVNGSYPGAGPTEPEPPAAPEPAPAEPQPQPEPAPEPAPSPSPGLGGILRLPPLFPPP